MRQVHDGLMLHDVYVFDPCSKEAPGSYQKWNLIVLTGILNFFENQIKKVLRPVIRTKNFVRRVLKVVVIFAKGFPPVLVYESNEQLADVNKRRGISVKLSSLFDIKMFFTWRIRKKDAVPAVRLTPQLILVCYVMLQISEFLLVISYIGHRKFLDNYV